MYFFTAMGIAAGLLAFVEIAFYIVAIFGRDYRWRKIRKTVPNRASWIIWACVGIITAASYEAAGARETIWFAVVYALGFIVVALLSFRHGEGGFGLTDVFCLLGAAASAWAWLEFRSPEIALFATISMDAFGAVPTVKKSWREPWTENRLAWSSSYIASVANMLAVDWNTATFAIIVYPTYMIIVNGLIMTLLYRKPMQRGDQLHQGTARLPLLRTAPSAATARGRALQ